MCAGGRSTGALAPSPVGIIEHAVQLHSKIVQNLVQFSCSRNRREHGQLAAVLSEHCTQSLARLEDPLDENHVFVPHAEMACDERRVEQFGEEQRVRTLAEGAAFREHR
jgi:hypothetical protein